MSRIAYVNGRYLPFAEATVHIEDRGYQFSDGVYEVCEVLGGRLVDECVTFARAAGYRRITLWTNSILDAARHLYERAGFARIGSERQHRFGHDLAFETWTLELGR